MSLRTRQIDVKHFKVPLPEAYTECEIRSTVSVSKIYNTFIVIVTIIMNITVIPSFPYSESPTRNNCFVSQIVYQTHPNIFMRDIT